jgi:cellulose biosynthesis protein BcsQ
VVWASPPSPATWPPSAPQQGLRTLVVDLDPQGNSTQYLLGGPQEDPDVSAAEFFDQTLKLQRPR